MTNIFQSSTGLAIGLATAILAFAPVCSQADESQGVTVQFKAAAANTPDGARALYRHLKQAADSACNTSDSDTDVIYRHGASVCVKQAIAGAVRRINSPMLSQVFIENVGSGIAKDYGVTADVLTARQ